MKSKQRQMPSCTWNMSHFWYMMTWQLQLHLQSSFCVMPADGWEFLSLVQRRECLTDARKPGKQLWDEAWWRQRMSSTNHCRKRLNQFQYQYSLLTGQIPAWANSCAISTLVQVLRDEQITCQSTFSFLRSCRCSSKRTSNYSARFLFHGAWKRRCSGSASHGWRLVEVCGSCSSQTTQCANSWESFGGLHFERQGWNSELAFDNVPVLVAGAKFCKSVRANNELTTHLCPNKVGDKARTSIAERCVQSVRGIQKTLLCHIEDELKVAIPDGHPVIQWAAMHAAWLYNRYQVHATMKVTPFQSLRGRPYHGKAASFGQTVFDRDPQATKFKPAWRKGCWLGKDTSGMDLICTDGQTIIGTKAVRKINNQ